MAIASQYPHFYEKDGVKKRNMLQVEYESPAVERGYPKDGSLTIRIQDETAQKAFKMTPNEAFALGEELHAVAKEMMEKKRKLWADRAPKQ